MAKVWGARAERTQSPLLGLSGSGRCAGDTQFACSELSRLAVPPARPLETAQPRGGGRSSRNLPEGRSWGGRRPWYLRPNLGGIGPPTWVWALSWNVQPRPLSLWTCPPTPILHYAIARTRTLSFIKMSNDIMVRDMGSCTP